MIKPRKHRSLAATPTVLNNFLGVSFGATETPRQPPDPHRTRLPVQVPSPPPSAGIVQFSLKKFLVQLLAADCREVQTQPNGLQAHLSIHAEGGHALESQLKREREITRQLTQELLTVRSALKQVEELRADLEVERETGRLLVQFLEDAERDARKAPFMSSCRDNETMPGDCRQYHGPRITEHTKNRRCTDASSALEETA